MFLIHPAPLEEATLFALVQKRVPQVKHDPIWFLSSPLQLYSHFFFFLNCLWHRVALHHQEHCNTSCGWQITA